MKILLTTLLCLLLSACDNSRNFFTRTSSGFAFMCQDETIKTNVITQGNFVTIEATCTRKN